MGLRLLFIVLLLFSATTAWGGQKRIADFDRIDGRDWIDAWSGSVTPTIDTADKMEGAGSLKLSYSFSAWGGVEYLRNFGGPTPGYEAPTQDYSFMLSGIAIRIKGNGSTDRFRFMLYEDVDRDGVFEDVWVYSNSNVLSNTAWVPITMALTSFKRQGGDNGSTLDLNRIGKWRIVIDNKDGLASTGREVRFDDMRLVNNYVLPATAKGLNGSFIQIWNGAGCNCALWTVQRWGEELQRMADAGMSTVIVQYGMWHGSDNTVAAFYPSALSFVNYRFDAIPNLLAAAQVRGMKVVVGLYFNQNWDDPRDWGQTQVYNDVVNFNTQVIDELWSLYGSHPAFGGWYIPQEIDDLNWQVDARRVNLQNMVQALAGRAKSKSAALPVMIAPFFRANQPADAYRQWWINFLAAAPSVDWIIPQDGVGTGDTDLDSDVPHYFRALQQAVAASPGRNLGATVESFQNVNGTFGPTTAARLHDQLKVASETASRLFQFEWPYMQPDRGVAYDTLYQGYKSLGLIPAP